MKQHIAIIGIEQNKKQIAKIIYIVLFMLVLVIPGIGTFIWKQEAMGNEEAVDFKDMNYSNAAGIFLICRGDIRTLPVPR